MTMDIERPCHGAPTCCDCHEDRATQPSCAPGNHALEKSTLHTCASWRLRERSGAVTGPWRLNNTTTYTRIGVSSSRRSEPFVRGRRRRVPSQSAADRERARPRVREPPAMVATIGQMASAEYYLESQRSFRHPNEYYTAGEEPDGAWFNPRGLFGLEDGGKVDSGHFHRLYSGFAPDGSGKLVQRAGNPERSPGMDMTFSVDKSVSALWAIAEPAMRERIEAMAVASARAALEDSVLRYCSYTRVSREGRDPAGGGGPDGRHLRPRHEPGERPAASRPLHDLQSGEDPGGRQVAGAPPVPGLQLEEGGGRAVPRQPGLGAATGPRGADAAVRPQPRVHPHRGHAGGPAILLVEAAQGDRRQGRRAGHSVAGQRLAHGRRQQAHAGGASRTTTTPR